MWSKLGSTLFGSTLHTSRALGERLSRMSALAILSSDALSSTAYATEELLVVLVIGGAAALSWSLPLTLAIVGLLALVTISYQQLIRAYPAGGGAYTVAKENLGTSAGLIAASGLLIDYILTVAVSVSAGTAALLSAFPRLAHYRIEIALLALLALMLVNLRGVRETGRAFTFPTMLFVISMFILLAVGFAKYFLLGAPSQTEPVSAELVTGVSLFLLLRAFSAGCTALTGIEAISNSTRIFKAPEVRNATRTMMWMAIILGSLFVGITYLARRYGVVHAADQTVLSQLARVIVGTGPFYYFYYVVQVSTLAILLMAANTAFTGFPRLASILGQDRYLPRQLSDVGSRLVYANGIILLTFLGGLLIVVFGGSVHRLIPLYAVGVFLSFTFSQAGLVRHWYRVREKGWIHGAIINGTGAFATAIALIVIAVTKFTHGAWLLVLLVPLFLYIFARIHKHYEMVERELTLEGFQPPILPQRLTVIVPVSGIHRAVLEALAYARVISSDVRAVYVASDMTAAEALRAKWKRYVSDVPLEVIYSPYRTVINPLLRYLDNVETQEKSIVTVVIPEFVPLHWWELFLHGQTAWMLKAALLFRKRIPVISVPHHLRR